MNKTKRIIRVSFADRRYRNAMKRLEKYTENFPFTERHICEETNTFDEKYWRKLKHANWLFSLCVVGYIVLFVMDMPIHALVSLNKHIFLPFCMVLIVVTLFVARHGETSRMERVLDYVGKRTLDVYVIHYFFISQIHLAGLAKAWEESGNGLLIFVLAIFLSVIVTALAIGVGNILHHGIWIEKIVYGKS